MVPEHRLSMTQMKPHTPILEDRDLLPYFQSAWQELRSPHDRLLRLMLTGENLELDQALTDAGLTDASLALKEAGLERALDEYESARTWLSRRRWFRGALRWADVILGSLASIPAIGAVVEPIKEWKESVEVQVDNEASSGRRPHR
ncbi:MAG: hypothetical protein AB7O74_06020 [Candidatus Nanopelagicales bacterium]